jgi:uncharacterized protein
MKGLLAPFVTVLLLSHATAADAAKPRKRSPKPPASATLYPDVEVRDWKLEGSELEYRVMISIPAEAAPPGGYPVIYVLDSNWMFGTTLDAVRRITPRPDVAEAVVVGIGYPNGTKIDGARMRDLTPAFAGAPEGAGGAMAFLSFIEKQLKPHVQSKFKIDTHREALIGHSFGGLFGLNTLLAKPSAFDTYIIASPSVWFGEKALDELKMGFADRLSASADRPSVLITVGEHEQTADPDFQPTDLKMLQSRRQVENAIAYHAYLNSTGLVDAQFELIQNEDHSTVVPAAVSRGVRFALRPVQKPKDN